MLKDLGFESGMLEHLHCLKSVAMPLCYFLRKRNVREKAKRGDRIMVANKATLSRPESDHKCPKDQNQARITSRVGLKQRQLYNGELLIGHSSTPVFYAAIGDSTIRRGAYMENPIKLQSWAANRLR
jgi:hypothetical protein